MAKNNVIITAGDFFIQKERRTNVITNPGEVLTPVVVDDEVRMTNAPAEAVTRGWAIVEFSSLYGKETPWKDLNRVEWDKDLYNVGDLIPVVYPLPGYEVNVMSDTNQTYTVGSYVTTTGDGQVKVTTDETQAIGICLEDLVVTDVNQMVKMEVL